MEQNGPSSFFPFFFLIVSIPKKMSQFPLSTALDVAISDRIQYKKQHKDTMTSTQAYDILSSKRENHLNHDLDEYVTNIILARAFMDKEKAKHLGVAAYRSITPYVLFIKLVLKIG